MSICDRQFVHDEIQRRRIGIGPQGVPRDDVKEGRAERVEIRPVVDSSVYPTCRLGRKVWKVIRFSTCLTTFLAVEKEGSTSKVVKPDLPLWRYCNVLGPKRAVPDFSGVDFAKTGGELSGKVQEDGDRRYELWRAWDNGMVVVVFGQHCSRRVVPVMWESDAIEHMVCMKPFEDSICAPQQRNFCRV
jgi:hypothetical protein